MVLTSVMGLVMLLIALLAACVVVVIKVGRERPRSRPIVRVRHVIGPVFLVITVVAIGVTPLGTLSFDMTYEVSSAASSNGDVIPVGEPATETIDVPLEHLPGTIYVVRGQGVAIESWEVDGDRMRVAVTIPPTEAPGTYSATLQLTPYPRVLPSNVLGGLHDWNPISAILGSVAALALPPYLLARLLLDGDRPLYRPRRRWIWRRLGDRP